MSKADEEFKHESLQDCESIVKYLNALSEGFHNGSLLFGAKQKQMVLEPHGLLNLEVKAKQKDRKVKFSIKLGWSERKDVKDQSADPLVIK